jgi:hypothetical protein
MAIRLMRATILDLLWRKNDLWGPGDLHEMLELLESDKNYSEACVIILLKNETTRYVLQAVTPAIREFLVDRLKGLTSQLTERKGKKKKEVMGYLDNLERL